ncbi:Subtilisin [Fusarium agapanthi]|uniref:Subtilisin n=1 Tax=Fusarium agapanthi TaxID=1803897 RepID=A0A9P5EG47_9HYPO|nr:Subtilisin [Fusarium agapanthi]
MSQESEKLSASEKNLFLVFLSKDLQDIAAVEFIRHTIQCTSFPPWADATGDLKSNIIEATAKQAEKIASHPDIAHITPIEATGLEDDTEPEDDSTRTVYVVRPTNRRDKDQCRDIHASLKEIFQDHLQPRELGPHGVSHWKVNSTNDQVPLAAKVQGVRSIVTLEQHLLEKSEAAVIRRRRMIRPIAVEYQDECKTTDTALKNLFGANVIPRLLQDGRISHWTAMLSSEEARQASALEGVFSVRTAVLGRNGPVSVSPPANACNNN